MRSSKRSRPIWKATEVSFTRFLTWLLAVALGGAGVEQITERLAPLTEPFNLDPEN